MSVLSNLNSLLHSSSLNESKLNFYNYDMVSQDFLIDLSHIKVNIRHYQSSDLREPEESYLEQF